MIVGLHHFNLPYRRTVGELKLQIGQVCKDLDLLCDLRLTTAWKVFLDDKDRDAFIELVNERLK